MKLARWATVAWGGALFVIGLFARHVPSVLEAGLTIASVLYGSLLGVFLLGLLTKSVRENAAIVGMLAGLVTMIVHLQVHEHCFYLVRSDRNGGDIWGRLSGASLVWREKNGAQSPLTRLSKTRLRQDLGIWSAAAIVVGTVIGSGIFLVPKTMILNVGTPGMVFVVWMVGGLLSLFGALSYAELAAALPEAGGEYVYLREAYGPFWGFIYGWTQMWVAKSGSIATLATAFFIYLANFQPELEGVWAIVPLPMERGGRPLEIRYGQMLAMCVILAAGARSIISE